MVFSFFKVSIHGISLDDFLMRIDVILYFMISDSEILSVTIWSSGFTRSDVFPISISNLNRASIQKSAINVGFQANVIKIENSYLHKLTTTLMAPNCIEARFRFDIEIGITSEINGFREEFKLWVKSKVNDLHYLVTLAFEHRMCWYFL